MKKAHYNKYLTLANCFAFIPLGVGHFIQIPPIIAGFCIGTCISLYLISLYALNHDINKLKNFKRNLISRVIKL